MSKPLKPLAAPQPGYKCRNCKTIGGHTDWCNAGLDEDPNAPEVAAPLPEPHPLRKIFEDGGATVHEDVPVPEEYRHELRWDRLDRKLQKCRIRRQVPYTNMVDVEFEDGFTAILDRRALRRVRQKNEPA